MNKVNIPNSRLWDIAISGENIDRWLDLVVGRENYSENIQIGISLPYRSFSFKDENTATLFALTWL